jgi:hypothetical protein
LKKKKKGEEAQERQKEIDVVKETEGNRWRKERNIEETERERKT